MSEYVNASPKQPLTPPPPSGQPYPAPVGSANARAPKRRTKMPIWLIVLLSVLGGILVFALGSCVVSGANPITKKVGIIDIDGTIGQDGGANTPEGLLAQLNAAQSDPQIAAVVLRVNSGGGAAAAGEEMAVYVKDFSKPVVVSSASGNASAAYLISSQADYIYANEASSVGAIGTVMQLTDYSKLLALLGIDVRTITSAESKDASYGHRPLTEEEIKYFQAQVDQINENFVETVAEGRGMEKADVQKLATGMSFTGEDAVENGLIDEIGTFKDACNKAAALSGAHSYRVEYLGSNELGLVDLLAALTARSDETNNRSNITLSEGASVNGQLS